MSVVRSSTNQPNESVQKPANGLLVLSNRLPIDYVGESQTEHGSQIEWEISPGGLVSALLPVMTQQNGTWIGWPGRAGLTVEPFESHGISLVPVELSEHEFEEYYEGFSNDTIWPLYHDVIHPPSYHREWWQSYQRVNRRFAERAAEIATPDTVVWIQDYQLQLVPRYLRELRPELKIGYFHHIPFPPYGIFSQLPWRKQILRGLLGADLLGFQRPADTGNFLIASQRLLGVNISELTSELGVDFVESAMVKHDDHTRFSLARSMPISIASEHFEALSRDPAVIERADEIRRSLGNPKKILLGVDRLDYTKGIRHRLKAFSELLEEERLTVGDVAMIQVATPSRENIESYRELRDEIELTIGRMNGQYGTMEQAAVTYLHHSYPIEEMVALYLAADVLLVTALRDGMNLVAKEYVATRTDLRGVLILSEFAGASDELRDAVLVNPHDIEGLKDSIIAAIEMPEVEQETRLRTMRSSVRFNSVSKWAAEFLEYLAIFEHSEADQTVGVPHD